MGQYQHLSDFDTDNRTALPKTAYYTFGNSATRDQMAKTFNPIGGNSPRMSEVEQMPGPGTYSYANKSMGTEGNRFQFLRKTKNFRGEFIC